MKKSAKIAVAKEARIRCAVYTRKSTEEGLQMEFNSLDAQRESAESYIASQQHEGWVCLPDRYDDGGFTGGNMERPALRRLLSDIEAGRVDCVVVYKVDRLSRSLLDFARIMECFDKHHVSFSSITQQFNTTHSMGRLTLNVLLSFAQFEREIIAERTRDKIAAARRKGKWSGGMPLLGYDLDVRGPKLLVNADEAARVRAIFELYLEHEALLPVVAGLERRRWVNKRWTTRAGHERGGRPFTKSSLYQLLSNVTYNGQVRYKQEIHGGEQLALVEPAVWQRVQEILHRNGSTGGAQVRNRFGALLKGLVRCVPCNCAMAPTHSKRGTKRYRYYLCVHAQKCGWAKCPSKAVPAGELERFVIERIRCVGHDPAILRATLAQAQTATASRLEVLASERGSLGRDLAHWHGEIRELSRCGTADQGAMARLADLHERVRVSERRLTELQMESDGLASESLTEAEIGEAVSAFEPVWETLTPNEQARLVGLMVERIDYDGSKGRVAITFHNAGIKALADEAAGKKAEVAS